MAAKRFAIYSVLLSEESSPNFSALPVLPFEFDRILLTDVPKNIPGWQTRLFEKHELGWSRDVRRPKILPHVFLPDYDASLYLDMNIGLDARFAPCVDRFIRSDISVHLFSHPAQRCIYKAAESAIKAGYDDEIRIRQQIDCYRKSGFPVRAGMFASDAYLRHHNRPDAINLAERWFEHILRYSTRDELALPFLLWKLGIRHEVCDLSVSGQISPPQAEVPQGPGDEFREDIYEWRNPDVEKSGLTSRQHFASLKAEKNLFYKKHHWDLRRLANKHRTDKGTLYYSAHGYADVYERKLAHLRKKPIRLLELGLLRHNAQARNPGGPYSEIPSLRMWREYFPEAKIFGFDIADFSLAENLPGVKIIRGDMGNVGDLEKLVQETGGCFDVIIDDASHASHHQQTALGFLFAHLNPSGFYFLEDLQYQPPRLEKPDARKTRWLLQRMQQGKIRPTPFISKTAVETILAQTEKIEFFDSLDRNFGRIHTDALAVLEKRK